MSKKMEVDISETAMSLAVHVMENTKQLINMSLAAQ